MYIHVLMISSLVDKFYSRSNFILLSLLWSGCCPASLHIKVTALKQTEFIPELLYKVFHRLVLTLLLGLYYVIQLCRLESSMQRECILFWTSSVETGWINSRKSETNLDAKTFSVIKCLKLSWTKLNLEKKTVRQLVTCTSLLVKIYKWNSEKASNISKIYTSYIYAIIKSMPRRLMH